MFGARTPRTGSTGWFCCFARIRFALRSASAICSRLAYFMASLKLCPSKHVGCNPFRHTKHEEIIWSTKSS